MIKKIMLLALMASLIILAFSGLAGAAMWDLKYIMTGNQMVPTDYSGAPWFADGSTMYFGTGKDLALKYDAAMDKFYMNDTDLYIEEDVTVAGTVTVPPDGFIDTDYGLKVSGTDKIQVNLTANTGLEFGTGAAQGSLQGKAGDGIDLGATGIAVDATDLAATAYGIKEFATNNLGVNITEDHGLEFGTGASEGSLQVEHGNGIKVSASGVAVEPTDIIDTSYGLLDNSDDIRINLTADDGLEFGTGATQGSLGVKTSDGLDTGASGVSVDVTDILDADTAYGLKENSNDLRVNLTSDGGLDFGTGATQGAIGVDVTDFIDTAAGMTEGTNKVQVNISADHGLQFGATDHLGELQVDPTDLIDSDTAYGLKETSDKLRVNITADKGLEFGTGAAQGALQIELDGTTLQAGASGLKVNPDLALTSVTVGGVIPPSEMVITFQINANSVDENVFIASDAWRITHIEEVHAVAGNVAAPNAPNLTIKKCSGTDAPTAGLPMHNTTLALDGAANTVQPATLSLIAANSTLADGDRIAADYSGTLTTLAGGSVTITMKRV